MKLINNLFIDYVEAVKERVEDFPKELDEQYQVIKQGFEGEKQFASLLNEIEGLWWIYDLQIKNYNQIQFDFLVITDDEIIQFEIKNFTGDYYYDNQKLYRSSGYVAKDLINQFEVAHDGLKRVIQKYNINRRVKSYIVFIHPTFTLHGDLRSKVDILVNSELYKLKEMVSNNFKYDHNKLIYDKLKSLHQPFLTNNKHFKKIQFDEINGGVRCTKCRKMLQTELIYNKRKYLNCNHCGTVLMRSDIIIKSLKELYLLKDAPFSVKEAEEWTGVSNSAIKRILYCNFEREGQGKATKYVTR